MIPPEFLAMLVCPVSKRPMIYFPADGVLVSTAARLKFRVENGCPALLAEEAQALTETEIATLVERARSLGLPIPT